MAQITRDDVAHVARLARLELTDDELELFTGQLAKVLDHARVMACPSDPNCVRVGHLTASGVAAGDIDTGSVRKRAPRGAPEPSPRYDRGV